MVVSFHPNIEKSNMLHMYICSITCKYEQVCRVHECIFMYERWGQYGRSNLQQPQQTIFPFQCYVFKGRTIIGIPMSLTLNN